MSSDMLNLCGLWTRKDKNGLDYFVGKLTRTTRIMVFNNKRKKSENEPDYYICLCKNEQRLEETVKPEEAVENEGGSDDIPF